jgi:hypothetical protein
MIPDTQRGAAAEADVKYLKAMATTEDAPDSTKESRNSFTGIRRKSTRKSERLVGFWCRMNTGDT